MSSKDKNEKQPAEEVKFTNTAKVEKEKNKPQELFKKVVSKTRFPGATNEFKKSILTEYVEQSIREKSLDVIFDKQKNGNVVVKVIQR